METDDEIVQDFITEAGEILEQLNEQLVQLENDPADKDLLNAVFRGFHTIKGGASFLNFVELVDICHCAEDVFNVLRQGVRLADAALMDSILQVLDFLNDAFEKLRAGEPLLEPDPALLQQVAAYATPVEAVEPRLQPESEQNPHPKADEVTVVDGLDSEQKKAESEPAKTAESDLFMDTPQSVSDSEMITEEEFEALLDELQGRGRVNSRQDSVGEDPVAQMVAETTAVADTAVTPSESVTSGTDAGGDMISDEEFEALLDQIHGKGKVVGAAVSEPQVHQPAAESPLSKNVDAVEPAKPSLPKRPAGKETVQSEATVRVDTRRLDEIMNMVGELVLVRNRLVTLENGFSGDSEVGKAVANLDVVTANLQTAVMKTRMQPIRKVFGRFPRVVRDLARNLKKEVTLELRGEDTDLDKNLVDALADPLIHLVRNAVDHGVELPEERIAAGKPRSGKLILAAEQEGDHILLTIEDDGAGMDAEKLRRSAVEKGLLDMDAANRMDDKECFNLIFQPGFSTKTEITDVSGRGVGMDVVKTKISQLNGSIEIDSMLGQGTRLMIKVPLTLAIIPTLMVKLGQQTFALPLVSVSEIFNLDLDNTNTIDGQLVALVREKAMPLFFLRQWLVCAPDGHGEGHVVVVHVGTHKVGFVVDELIGQEEVVIKPLDFMLQGTPGMAGATITGDGRIALIIDVPGLMGAYAKSMSYVH